MDNDSYHYIKCCLFYQWVPSSACFYPFIIIIVCVCVFVYNFLSYVTIGSTPSADQMVVMVLLVCLKAYWCICASVYIWSVWHFSSFLASCLPLPWITAITWIISHLGVCLVWRPTAITLPILLRLSICFARGVAQCPLGIMWLAASAVVRRPGLYWGNCKTLCWSWEKMKD